MNEQVSRANSGRNWNQGSQDASFYAIPERYNYFPIPDSEKAVNKLITGNNPGW